jgi:outer membrane protein assembly factor BamB
MAEPLLAGDRLYVGFVRDDAFSPRGALYCLDRHTRAVRWQFDDGGRMLPTYSRPCLAGGRLFFGEGMHAHYLCRLRCLDPATGQPRWHADAHSHIESGPCAAAGRVFVGAGDDGLFALDAATGRRLWHFHPGLHVDTSPAVEGGRLYAGSGVSLAHSRTEAFCLDAATGGVLWRAGTDLPVWGSPVLAGAEVFFGLGNGRLTQDAAPPEKPAGAVLCLDARTGGVRWRRGLAGAVFSRVAVGADRVVAGCRDGRCYCLDRRDGRVLWAAGVGSPVVTRPALVGGRVYVAAFGGRVCCLDAGDGTTRWSFDTAAGTQAQARLVSSPAVVEEAGGGARRIYFGAELRTVVNSAAVVYCLEEKRQGEQP